MPRTDIDIKRRAYQAGLRAGVRLSMAHAAEIDENGAITLLDADGAEQAVTLLSLSETLSIDTIPVLSQENIAIAL